MFLAKVKLDSSVSPFQFVFLSVAESALYLPNPIGAHGVASQGTYSTTLTAPLLAGVGPTDLVLVGFHTRGVSDGSYSMVCNASNRPKVLTQLEMHRAGFEAEMQDLTFQTAMIAVLAADKGGFAAHEIGDWIIAVFVGVFMGCAFTYGFRRVAS